MTLCDEGGNGDGRNSASSAADPPIETASLSRRSVTLNLVPPTPYLNVVECFLGRRLAEFIPVKRPPLSGHARPQH